jgi:tetratricopeptide (TPR) repeat protein
VESRAAIDLYERARALSEDGQADAWPLAGIGEARYWLGEYDAAEESLTAALERGGDEPDVVALAARFLGDIALNIRGQPDQAERLFDEAEAAARKKDNAWAMSRTLLMAGWVPYWRGDYEAARERFEQALEISRENPEDDRWGEARAVISLAGISSALGKPLETIDLADRALALGREIGDPFTIATAQERRSTSLRAMWRLDEALACSNEAVQVYRDLGARWELSSALGDRGAIHRLLTRFDAAEADLREALALCQELGDRVLIVWTTAELATILTLDGRAGAARELLESEVIPPTIEASGDRTAVHWAWTYVFLAEGERDAARDRAVDALRIDREVGREVSLAITTWWVAALFGPDAVGGDDEVDRARKVLEEMGWVRAFREVDQVQGALAAVR